MNRFALLALCMATLFFVLPISNVAGDVIIVDRFSGVVASDDGTGDFEGDFFDQPGFWTGSVAVGEISASQTSLASSDLIEIQSFADGAESVVAGSDTEGISNFSVSFDVTNPTHFSLEGTLEELGTGEGITSVQITGTNIFITSDPDEIVNISESGILAPGSYGLFIDSISLGFGNSIGPELTTDVSLTFTVIPEPSSVLLLAIATACVCQRRRD